MITKHTEKFIKFDINSLRKILELEKNKGFNDTAIIGGLDNYLERIGITQYQEGKQQNHNLKLSQKNYSDMGIKEREKWILDMLTNLEAGNPLNNKYKATTSLSEHKKITRSRQKKQMSHTTTSSLDSPISTLKGVGAALNAKFNKLGINTIRDILYFFPIRHLDYTQIKHISELNSGSEQSIIATIWQARETRFGNRRGTEAILSDETGTIRAVWFNQPYLVKKLQTNSRIIVSGKVTQFRGNNVLESPEWEPLQNNDRIHTGRFVPIYSLTSGMHPRSTRKLMKEIVTTWAPLLQDFLPAEMIQRNKFLPLDEAIRQAHYPDNDLLKDASRKRLAFDEIFLIQLGTLLKKIQWQKNKNAPSLTDVHQIHDKLIKSLPFPLTQAQSRSLNEILSDIRSNTPMTRLLQGDVGSGKTVVATAALLISASSGHQGAFMAPTEILAEQHFNNLSGLLSLMGKEHRTSAYVREYTNLFSRPLTIALLTGAITGKEKKEIQKSISEGAIDIIIGTHALIQKETNFHNLGLVVIDEQHRFGVEQRSLLRQKGTNPHILVMTATPIPRSLALTLYGDLDLSVIDELPPGRQVIKTILLNSEQRERGYRFIHDRIDEGRQAFIICPLVEESEKIISRAAIEEHRRLSQNIFPDLRVGLIHGRMSSQEKETVMRHFHDGLIDILVATAVIEVGIDVPNATIILIEGAERFGLSQLHQFRGRVGRGSHQSYCLLLADSLSSESEERLRIIEHTHDGFQLAEADLKMRGPGEFFGTRQSGLPDFRMARLSDRTILELARNEALHILQDDAELKSPQHRLLVKEMQRVWKSDSEWS